MNCAHVNIRCLNEFELIRKYRCGDCGAVMMCTCDEPIGRKHLPHQLDYGSELETRQRVPVTGGFQPAVCSDCRGLVPVAHPVAEIYGRTSKIRRYYWRELAFQTMERVAVWAEKQPSATITPADKKNARKRIEKEVLDELKALHQTSPKYSYADESEGAVITKYDVEMVALKGVYVATPQEKGVAILDDTEPCDAEEFASRYFRKQGFETLLLESVPFHVLFGVFMWLVIQDFADPRVRVVSFGDRHAFDAGMKGPMVSTPLPEDFGAAGYAERRAEAIDEHFSDAMHEPGQLHWLFDYWLEPSKGFRQYLWAHRDKDVQTARRLIDILPAEAITKILRYLAEHYWGRYLGWPDLLVYRDNEFFFAEVKSSRDKLSQKQRHWIGDNRRLLNFSFKLVKIHKTSSTSLKSAD